MKVVVTRPIPEVGLDLIRATGAEVVVHDDRPKSEDELCELVQGADVIIPLLSEKITQRVLDAAGEQLRAICQFTVGYDNVDVEALKAKNLRLTNTPGAVSAPAVVETALALMFAIGRHMLPADRFMRSGQYSQWDPNLFLGADFAGKTVGIIGSGQIGAQFAAACHNGLKMRVVYYDVQKNERIEKELGAMQMTIEQVLHEADVVSLHVPLLDSTRHLMNAERFGLMKPTAILLNTSRGPVVDEVALLTALQNKQIAGAGIDVYENEPNFTPGLEALDNVVMTPHIGSATFATRLAMSEACGRNAVAVLTDQEVPNLIKF